MALVVVLIGVAADRGLYFGLGLSPHAFRPRGTGRVEMILALPTKIVALHVRVSIVEVGVSGLEWPIAGRGVCLELAIFLASNEQL